MMIHKITPYVHQNRWLKRFNTQLNESTNQKLIKVLKVVKPTSYYKSLRTSVIKRPLSPLSLLVTCNVKVANTNK